MAKIINLNELVGEDIVFQYGTPMREYRMSGDIDVDTVFELFHMFTTVNDIKGDKPEDLVGEVKQKFADIRGRLLLLFQERDPKLEKLPFGIRGTGIVLRTVLSELGVSVEAGNPTPPSPPRRTSQKKTAARARK